MDARGSLRRLQTRAGLVTCTPASLLTYLLFCAFGVGSWVALNGIWGELSILVTTLPECYDLPAILSVVTQLANVGPIVYIILKLSLHRHSVQTITIETAAVYVIVSIGLVSCVLLSILWDRTAVVAGETYSVALIVLTFCLALADCTSTLVFIPIMKHFPATYISALYIGEGLSGVLPSLTALSQGFVNDSLGCVGSYSGMENLGIYFSPNVYFIFLASLTILCGLAFTAIRILPIVRRQILPTKMSVSARCGSPVYASSRGSSNGKIGETESEVSGLKTSEEEEVTESREVLEKHTSFSEGDSNECEVEEDSSPLIRTGSGEKDDGESDPNSRPVENSNKQSTILRFLRSSNSYPARLLLVAWNNLLLLVCMFVLNFITNGALPSISAFIFKSYGNTVYHVAINLGILSAPLATLLYVFLSNKSRVVIAILTAIASLLGTYLLVMATLSPDPLLKDHPVGDAIIVSVLRTQCGMNVFVLTTRESCSIP